MSILSKHPSDKRTEPPTTSNPKQRPRLYILATRPSTPEQVHFAEWSLDLCIPSTTTAQTLSRPAAPSHRSSFFRSKTSKHKNEEPLSPAVEDLAIKTSNTEHEKHYYFSRLTPGTPSEKVPTNVTLKIFLTSFPSTATTTTCNMIVLKHFSESLEAVHLTPDSASWLKQALFSLQISDVLPPASHGLDINKFTTFATSYLQQHLRESDEIKEVNYSKVLRENQRLRRMFSSENTDYAVVNEANDRTDQVNDDEDIWTTPARSQPAKGQKTWGGFWISHGSERHNSGHDNRRREYVGPRERSNVYGGLM